MSDQFVAEIRVFGFNFPPTGWAFCNGQILPISQNTALFALLGTTYGGDGKSTFALPNLAGSVPMHPNNSPGQTGLSTYDLGRTGGSETTTLLQSEIPAHTHAINVSDQPGDNAVPTNHALARYPGAYQQNVAANQQMAFESLPIAGASFPHNNMMPYLTLSFCIALQGIFPPRG
jgi:microcystin-dependent protein